MSKTLDWFTVRPDVYQNEQPPGFTQPASGTENRNLEAIGQIGGSTKRKKNCLEIKLYGKEIKAIVENGCDVIDERTIQTTKVKLTAINETLLTMFFKL